MRTPSRPRLQRLRTCLTSIFLVAGLVAVVPAEADVARRGETKLVSQDANGLPADGGYSDVSDDGRYVAFESWDRLSIEDTDDNSDVYIRDMVFVTTTLASPDVAGVSEGLCNSHPSLSADGTKLIHYSGYTPNFSDQRIFRCGSGHLILRDLANGTSRRLLSPSSGFDVENARLSGDGRWVVVHMSDDVSDDYVSIIDVSNGSISWTSSALCWGCVEGELSVSISADGRFITFLSRTDWVAGDSDGDRDVYIHDRDTDRDGIFDELGAMSTGLASILPNGSSPHADQGAVSDDGKFVAFLAEMTRVCVPRTTSCWRMGELSGLYIRDMVRGSTEFITSVTVSPLQGGTGDISGWLQLAISSDGRFTVFSSNLPLAPSDTNASTDAYVYDSTTRRFSLASVLPQQAQGPVHVTNPSLSSSGRFVTFNTDLVPITNFTDMARAVYIRDMFAPCVAICAEEQIPDPDTIIDPVIDAALGPVNQAVGTVHGQLAGKVFAPYDSSKVCAIWSVPRASTSLPVRTDATNYCWNNDSAQSRGYDISSAPIYGVLEVGGWDYLWAPPVIDGYAASVYRAELTEKSLPSAGNLTVSAHISGAITAVPPQFVDKFKGCLRLIDASSGSTVKLSCFDKTSGVKDLTVTAAVTGPVWAVVALEMTGDVGQATAVVSHFSYSVSE